MARKQNKEPEEIEIEIPDDPQEEQAELEELE